MFYLITYQWLRNSALLSQKKARITSSKLETIRTSLLIKLTQQQVRLFRADQ